MCGIAGFWGMGNDNSVELTPVISKMTEALHHRGPDAGDCWTSARDNIALGHRRLAIVDLSENGAQPMRSEDGRYIIVYNGEIYNYRELQADLTSKGYSFRGNSDTEVLLASIHHCGIKETLSRLIGMFAFAVWDCKTKRLFLARDRLGIKPLYWGFKNGTILFGSELKALKLHPYFEKDLNLTALTSFFRHNYIPAPHTIYLDIFKLEQGHFLEVTKNGDVNDETFWTLEQAVQQGQNNPFAGNDSDATDTLEQLLKDSVARRMIADVPLGAFLSGGVDSSTIAALMQNQSAQPIKTFSIGFEEASYNEAQHAKEVAKHLKTDHTELYVSGEQARDVIPNLARYYDEPFSDSSQIPTFLVSQMTRQHVTVALSGDGGDELFAGYTRYTAANSMADKIFSIPKPIRKCAASVIGNTPPSFWNTVSKIAPRNLKFSNPGNKAKKIANVLRGEKSDLYRTLVSHWENPNELVKNGYEKPSDIWDSHVAELVPNFVERMQYIDTMTYMADDILTKVDRASMAVALEVRVPMIDHRVVEFAWSLPFDMKIRSGTSKWLLREVLYRHVPKNLIERPKMGFGIPIAEWLRGPLKEWASELLDDTKMRQAGILLPEPIQKKWNEHISGQKDWGYYIWDVLMFQAWYDEWIDQ